MKINEEKKELLEDTRVYLNQIQEIDKQETPKIRISKVINNNGKILFSKRVYLHDINMQEDKDLIGKNQREPINSESPIELDLNEEEKLNPIIAKRKFEVLINRLKKEKIKFRAYCTKSFRHLRIEIFWTELGQKKEEERKKIREYIIRKYGGDLSYTSDKQNMSFGIHYKTKEKISLYDSWNFKNNPRNDYSIIKEEVEEYFKTKQIKEVNNLFYSKWLLSDIIKELNKRHIGDNKEKLALFISRATGELKNPENRCSCALKGNSSAGKDNIIKTILKHYPKEDNLFLTSATPAVLEHTLKHKCIAFSEMNKHRENGANSFIVENLKQLTEGGSVASKMDQAKGFKEAKITENEQKIIFYGTTESETDEELSTRFVVIPIKTTEQANKEVVNDIFIQAGDLRNLKESYKEESWISKSIRNLKKGLDVKIPYSEKLISKIKDKDNMYKDLFNFKESRIKRDAKRLLNLTKAITWIYQKQRELKEYKGIKYLESKPIDFILAISIFAEFFNLTYSGLDFRLQQVLDKGKELQGKHDDKIRGLCYPSKYNGRVIRHLLAEELGIKSVNTIKKYCKDLQDLGFIKSQYYDYNTNQKAYLLEFENKKDRPVLPINIYSLMEHLGVTEAEFKEYDLNFLLDEFKQEEKELKELQTKAQAHKKQINIYEVKEEKVEC